MKMRWTFRNGGGDYLTVDAKNVIEAEKIIAIHYPRFVCSMLLAGLPHYEEEEIERLHKRP